MTTTKRTGYLTADATRRLTDLIGELGDLASFKDIDCAALIMESCASILGIAPETMPHYSEVKSL
jgi:hypothetical protein